MTDSALAVGLWIDRLGLPIQIRADQATRNGSDGASDQAASHALVLVEQSARRSAHSRALGCLGL